MDKETKNWLNMVEYDLVTARQMLKTGRCVYVIFMCHMAIEKALKAIIVESTQGFPPRTHNLIYLIEKGKVSLPQELLEFVGIINNAAVATRYPEDISKLVASYPKKIAASYLEKTEEIVKWIEKDPKLQK